MTEGNSLFNQFNMVWLSTGPPRETGRVYLEDDPRFRPTLRQDEGSVAGGVSRSRSGVGILGSLHPAGVFPLLPSGSGFGVCNIMLNIC